MPLDMNTPRILAIHAHPDDIEFQCAGTLAILAEKGCKITMVTMTPGDCGSAQLGPEEIARIRRDEARKSADLLGADYECLEFRDLAIVHDNAARRTVTEALRRARPDIVITAPFVDYMSDHEMTARLVRDACFNAPIPNYVTGDSNPAAPIDHIPHLYLVEPIEGTDYLGNVIGPEFLVDVSQTFELKLQMLACHDSQRAWLRKQHGMDEYLDNCRRLGQKRGRELGVEFAEGFTQYKGHPYPADNRLLEILAAK